MPFEQLVLFQKELDEVERFLGDACEQPIQ